MDLSQTTTVVTGGADGIGLAIARQSKLAGANVVIADVDAEKVNARSAEEGFSGVICDVRLDEDVARLADVAEEIGEVGLVVANAGIAVGGRFEMIPTTEWERLFDVNVHGTVRTINAFLPTMLKRGRGRIVVTGSSAGLFDGDGFNTPYAASKHALRAMAQGLMIYCKDAGVDVHYLAPRITDTAFPRSSTAWGRSGSHITRNRSLGDDYDTVEDVVEALFEGMAQGDFLISLSPNTKDRLEDQLASTPGLR